MNNQKHTKLLEKFILSLNEQRYYDAHSYLEEIWFPRRFEDNNEIKLLKGFINASVSFELYKRGKFMQSKNIWRNYLKYRQLLYKTDSLYKNRYQAISRDIDKINREILQK